MDPDPHGFGTQKIQSWIWFRNKTFRIHNTELNRQFPHQGLAQKKQSLTTRCHCNFFSDYLLIKSAYLYLKNTTGTYFLFFLGFFQNSSFLATTNFRGSRSQAQHWPEQLLYSMVAWTPLPCYLKLILRQFKFYVRRGYISN